MQTHLLTGAFLILAHPALATQGALTAEQAITLATQESRDWCSSEGGTLTLPDNPATAVDLTGDGTADDWMVNDSGAFCGPDLGYLGGSGGAMIHAVVGSKVESWLAGAWVTQDISFTIEGEVMPPVRTLLLGLHGSSCDTFGAAPCILALTWDGDRLVRFTPAPDDE